MSMDAQSEVAGYRAESVAEVERDVLQGFTHDRLPKLPAWARSLITNLIQRIANLRDDRKRHTAALIEKTDEVVRLRAALAAAQAGGAGCRQNAYDQGEAHGRAAIEAAKLEFNTKNQAYDKLSAAEVVERLSALRPHAAQAGSARDYLSDLSADVHAGPCRLCGEERMACARIDCYRAKLSPTHRTSSPSAPAPAGAPTLIERLRMRADHAAQENRFGDEQDMRDAALALEPAPAGAPSEEDVARTIASTRGNGPWQTWLPSARAILALYRQDAKK